MIYGEQSFKNSYYFGFLITLLEYMLLVLKFLILTSYCSSPLFFPLVASLQGNQFILFSLRLL